MTKEKKKQNKLKKYKIIEKENKKIKEMPEDPDLFHFEVWVLTETHKGFLAI